MPHIEQHSTPDEGAERLARLANTLSLNVAPEDLAALSEQLRMLEELERDELQDYPPILKMDADWHD